MKLVGEFKKFAIKGNMIDMAIGIIIGASFNKVLDILVKKVLLPPLTYMSSGVTLADKKFVIREAVDDKKELAIEYGLLAESFIDFFVIGLTLFVVVKVINKLKDKADDVKDKTVATPKNIELLSNIDKSLKELNNKMSKDG
jgi:large conductance mechanosensitive channel